MKTAAVIAEYNPFHRGHCWQLSALRQQGFTHLISIISGNFVQRGEPALFSKYDRARSALLGGADLVLELPLPYACACAQRFAFGGVLTAHLCGCIDALCFGSECGSMETLRETVKALQDPHLKEFMAPFLQQGNPFAKARSLALEAMGLPQAARLLQEPNNTLAVEYMLQLEALHSPIEPVTLQRQGAGHGDTVSSGDFASATLIRSLVREGRMKTACGFVPEACVPLMMSADPARMDDRILLARLRSLSRESLSALPDCSEGIENRLYDAIRKACSAEELLTLAKTKRYSMARLRRLMMAAFLEIPADLCTLPPPYIRVLGFNRRGQELLAVMKKSAAVPVSGSLAQLAKGSPLARRFALLESQSCDLYSLFTPDLSPCGGDFRFSPIRLSGE